MSHTLTPPARLIDPRGHRFGAAVSVAVLGAAVLLAQPLLVAFIAAALGVSAAFGTRYSLLGRPWPVVRRALRLASVEPEHEYPPRFAQALGTVGLTASLVLFAAGITPLAWLPVLAVAGLQALLAVTGLCVGCRLYFLRWWVPELFARAAARARSWG